MSRNSAFIRFGGGLCYWNLPTSLEEAFLEGHIVTALGPGTSSLPPGPLRSSSSTSLGTLLPQSPWASWPPSSKHHHPLDFLTLTLHPSLKLLPSPSQSPSSFSTVVLLVLCLPLSTHIVCFVFVYYLLKDPCKSYEQGNLCH